MNNFFNKLGSKKLSIISKIVMILGIALLALSLWGFIKSSHTSMSSKNGVSTTLVIVNARWVTMPLGAIGLGTGFLLMRRADSMDDENEEDEQSDDNSDDWP